MTGDHESDQMEPKVAPLYSLFTLPKLRTVGGDSNNHGALLSCVDRQRSPSKSESSVLSGGDQYLVMSGSEGSRNEGSPGLLGKRGLDSPPLMGKMKGREGSRATTASRGTSVDRGLEDFGSGGSSPLLQTEALPEDDATLCPYCHKDFRKPRVLDCLHSMCEDCIIAQLDGRREAAKARELESRMATDCVLEERARPDRPTPPGVIRCAVCAQESHVGNDIRFVHSMLIDYVRVNEADEARGERSCRACKSEQPAVAYCKQCGSDLCSNCLQAHRDMRMFDGHEVLSYAELEATGRAADARRVLCSVHGQPFVVLCATCEALACRVCLEGDHIGHKMVDVTPVVVAAISKELDDLVNKLNAKWQDSVSVWDGVPDRTAALHQQYEDAKALIDVAYDEAARILDESKKKKFMELEKARDRQESSIEDLYAKVNATQTKVDDAYRFTQRLLAHANGVELLASRKKVIHQLRQLEHTMPTLSTAVELQFVPTDRKKLESGLGNAVGMVVCGGVAVPSDCLPTRISAVDGGTVVSTVASDWPPPVTQVTPSPSIITSSASSGALNGLGGPSILSSATITPIGGERAAKKAQGVPTTAASAFNGGWPPSSNPPELPSPSPPKDSMQQQAAALAAAAANVAPPTGTPAGLPSPMSAPSAPFPPWAAALAAGASGATDPRLAAALAAGGFPGAAGGGSQAANAAAKLQMQLLLQQQQNLLLQRQFGAAAAAAAVAAGGGAPSVDPALLRQMLTAAAADQNLLQTASTPLGKGMAEIKLAFAHGTGAAGNSIRELHSPGGFAVAENDDLLIADTNNHRVVVITPTHPWKFGRPGQEDGHLCFPRRVVAMRGGGENPKYVVIDKATDNKSRAQLFSHTGEFMRRINLTAVVPKGGIEVWAATSTPTGHLVMVDQSSVIYILDIKETQPRVVNWFDASNHLLEASDVAVHDKAIFVTDFKGHCVHVFSHEGTYLRKIGEPSHTPFPIGIDVARTGGGELFVAHTHGNKLTIVCYSQEGSLLQQFVNCDFRVRVDQMSRCASLRLTSGGHVVTLSKHAHTLYGFRRVARSLS